MRIASSFDVASGATPTGCAHVDDPAGFSRLATAVGTPATDYVTFIQNVPSET